MCGRYQFTADESEELTKIVKEVERKSQLTPWTPGEIRPTAFAPVLLPGKKAPEAELLTWGFKTTRSLIINARSETALDKPLFRERVMENRCVIPAAGFYEWDSEKRKFFFTVPGKHELYMAGILGFFERKLCFCILTTAANSSMADTHDRMPLILDKEQIEPWLYDASAVKSILHLIPPQLLRKSMEAQESLW